MKELFLLGLTSISALCLYAQKGLEKLEKGILAYNKHLYIEAVSWYEKAVAQGNVITQNNLDVCYQEGKGNA